MPRNRYYVIARFGGETSFFEDFNEACNAANACLGYVFDTTNVPSALAYDAAWDLDSFQLESILRDAFHGFEIIVE